MTIEADQAAAALEAMRASRERLAAAANCPPARHLAFAGLMGAMVASQAAPPMATIAIEALLLVGVGLLLAWDRRRTGMFINGYRVGRTQPVTLSLLLFALAMLAVGIWLKAENGLVWAPLACGLVVAVVSYVASAFWQRIYRHELQELP